MDVILIVVTSLDGRITSPRGVGPEFASTADQQWFSRVLGEFDCSVMGRATYEAIPAEKTAPAHEGRLRTVLTRKPEDYAKKGRPGAVEFTADEPQAVVAGLANRGYKRCALLGGGQIYRAFLTAGLVDAAWVTLEPVVLGGGILFADGDVVNRRFELHDTKNLSGDTLLLNYRRPESAGIPFPDFVL